VLALQLLTRTRTEDVRPIFERLFDKYGLRKAIQSDNGREPEVRVWFFDVLLGAFDPRTQQSVEPITSQAERA
jgi:hypothetical protein